MKETIILLLATVLIAREGLANIICSEASPDLCIGFSGDTPRVFQQLQLKSRRGLILRNNTGANWTLSPTYNNIALRDSRLTIGVYENKEIARLLNESARAFFTNGTVQLPGSLCITPMQCLSNGNSFCDPLSAVVSRPGKLKKGSYLRWRKCSWVDNQRFVLNPPCAQGCSFRDQGDESCKVECMTAYCMQTGNYTCPGLSNITDSPTVHPTSMPTAMPSLAPSKTPTEMPLKTPTGSPTSVWDNTAAPTTVRVTTTAPTTATPSVSPTRPPETAAPTLVVTNIPTSSPVETQQPPPDDDTLSPTTSRPSSSSPDTVLLPVLLTVGILVFCPLIWLLVYGCYLGYCRREKPPTTTPPPPEQPPAPAAEEEPPATTLQEPTPPQQGTVSL